MPDVEFELTPAERHAIRVLNRLEKRWPKSLWLFSAHGDLHIMRNKSDNKAAVTEDGAYDVEYSVCGLSIQNDGGDW